MQHPKKLSISDFSYYLPEEKIAAFPLQQRDQSKLLVYENKRIHENIYGNIASLIPEHALLVFNNSKVIEARLLFQKPTGGVIEVFLLEPQNPHADIGSAMLERETARWNCLVGGAGKWKHGQVLHRQTATAGNTVTLEAGIAEKLPGSFSIAFHWSPGHYTFSEIIHLFGAMPVPPYLKRNADTTDYERYQTIYASREGSVAAPTAGLHFTPEVFESLKARNIAVDFVTLHVGAGTFLPVKSGMMEGHTMHAEFIEADAAFIRTLTARAPEIFAVGTTSLRTLESLYWMGVKCLLNPGVTFTDLEVKQWEVYDQLQGQEISAKKALLALTEWMNNHNLEKLIIKTQILIAPGYQARMVRALITNFHQPDSTLLLLVAALIGKDWRMVYDYALQHDFRFLSYGDGCLLYIPTAGTGEGQW